MAGGLRARLETHGLWAMIALCALAYIGGGLAYCLVGRGTTLFVNDGFHYYAYLPSLLLDRDLDFTDEYALGRAHDWMRDYESFNDIVPATGRPGNPWAIGSALLWLPFFLIGLGLEWLFSAHPVNGFSLWCQWPVYLGTLVYELLALWALYRVVLADYGRTTRLVAVALLLIGTNLSYYFLFAGHMSHGLSFSAVVLLLACLRRLELHPTRLLPYLASGAAVSVVTLVRWQDAVFALLPLVLGVRLVAKYRARALMGVGLALLGPAAALAIQATVWHSIYGHAFLVPQGSGWMDWGRPYVPEVLLSFPKGLVPNSPVVVFGLVGLGLLARRDRWWSVASLLTAAAVIYVCAASSQWEAGESFGMRRMVGMLPLAALGLCELRPVLLRHPRPRLLWAETGAVLLWHLALLGVYFVERLQNP